MASSQRLLSITSPLGDEALTPVSLTSHEQLGQPFQVDLVVLAVDAELAGKDLLTKEVTAHVTVSVDGSPLVRHFNGVVAVFERLGPADSSRSRYQLSVVPGIWRLSLGAHCRIFQGKTVKQVVTSVLADHGQPAPQWGILPDLQAMDYCTQFNETDLDFLGRLLDEHGLTYYFTHSESAHTLHISSTAPGFPVFEGGDVVATQASTNFHHLTGWERAQRARSAAAKVLDMDGERSQPSVTLTQTANTRTYAQEPGMWPAGAVTRWPGGMATRPGVQSAAIWMGGLETEAESYRAESLDPRHSAGTRLGVAVRLDDGSEVKQQFVVTRTHLTVTDDSTVSMGGVTGEHCSVDLGLVSAARTWMPRATHPRPVMAGVYSAKVTGPSGEKIHVDEFGRIKVKFRWDSLAGDDDTTSCWIRVAQAAAGAWGGTWFLPRVGDEVLVAFLDGDPDRPVVTGSVYGKDAKPPFLPGDHRSQSGIHTQSYKSDSTDDANILRFEDKKGEEDVLLHAQRNLTVEVEHDESRTVDNARTTIVKAADDTLTLEQGNRVTTVKSGNDTLTVKQGNEAHEVNAGNFTLKCDQGSITLEAMQKITLKVGSNTIEIAQSGITIKGMMISSEAQTQHATKGLTVQTDAQAMVTVNGALVKIN